MSTNPPREISPGEHSPTLLVFTLGPEAERRRRRLLPARLRDRERGLYDACMAEALAAGRANGCRLEVASPADVALGDLPSDARRTGQRGTCFGERFADSFDAAFARTGDDPRSIPTSPRVIAVGTDTPGLRTHHVARALALLDDNGDRRRERVVVGPSPDGGFYLLAANRPLGALLRQVRWCRSDTLAHLRRVLEEAGLSVLLLEPLADLDRRSDLEGWLARRGGRPAFSAGTLTERWAAAVSRALAALRRPPAPRVLGRPRFAPAPARRGRAPPTLLSL